MVLLALDVLLVQVDLLDVDCNGGLRLVAGCVHVPGAGRDVQLLVLAATGERDYLRSLPTYRGKEGVSVGLQY